MQNQLSKWTVHTFFVKDIKDIKVASAHYYDVFGIIKPY